MNREKAFHLSRYEEEAWEIVKCANNLVITSHIHPDGDAIGSCLALLWYCIDLGKDVSVVIDDNIPNIYDFLDGYERIIKPNQYGGSPDVVIVLDTNLKRIGRASSLNASIVINIDHHGTNQMYCDYHIIRAEASSTTELLYRLFCKDGYDINPVVAECLYIGLVTDTVFFKTPGICMDTYQIAGELVECGADPVIIAQALERKSYNNLILTSKALSNTKLYCDGRIAGVCLDESFDELDLTDEVIDSIRYIDGISIAFLLKREKKGGFRVRMRSSGFDVSQIAKANGGGGHSDAAGFTIYDNDATRAEEKLVGELIKWLEQCIG